MSIYQWKYGTIWHFLLSVKWSESGKDTMERRKRSIQSVTHNNFSLFSVQRLSSWRVCLCSTRACPDSTIISQQGVVIINQIFPFHFDQLWPDQSNVKRYSSLNQWTHSYQDNCSSMIIDENKSSRKGFSEIVWGETSTSADLGGVVERGKFSTLSVVDLFDL